MLNEQLRFSREGYGTPATVYEEKKKKNPRVSHDLSEISEGGKENGS